MMFSRFQIGLNSEYKKHCSQPLGDREKWTLKLKPILWLLITLIIVSCSTVLEDQKITQIPIVKTTSTPTLVIKDPREYLEAGTYFVYWSNGDLLVGSQTEIPITDWPQWGNLSPDGEVVVYAEDQHLFTFDMRSAAVHDITPKDINILEATDPTWSPDGQWIAFAASTIEIQDGTGVVDEFPSIFAHSLVDGQTYKLTHWPAVENYPEWSPDGSSLVFASDHLKVENLVGNFVNETDLFLMRTDCLIGQIDCQEGISVFVDTGEAGNASMPSWSADSRKIAFRCGHHSLIVSEDQVPYQTDICVINVDGSGYINITNTSDINEFGPVWSPDSSFLAFTSHSYNAELYDYDDDIVIVSMPEGIQILNTDSDDNDEVFSFWFQVE
jgi:dipeptidyl aminopeptidase/acylaminoacyl peptidase